MCDTWKYPSKTREEFDPKILEKIPSGMKRLNITGGEPMLRKDIEEIVRILDKKSERLEISTNGYFTDRLENITKKFSDITIRVSVEGLPALNDQSRGIKNGFDRALRTVLRLKRMGLKDIGFAMTISGDNCHDLLDLHTLVSELDVEFANAIIHNSFYFHKNDNKIENSDEVQDTMIKFMEALLQSPRRNIKRRIKDWFRAYINLGLLMHLKGQERLIACGAATDTFFLDPWGQVIACNGSPQPMIMGSLVDQPFGEIWNSEQAEQIRKKVKSCKQNCWMTGTAVPAMRKKPWQPIKWVLNNKLRLYRGQKILI
jgi:MoaA/NifB/PqqE/SkfB family radical SAM enzyme